MIVKARPVFLISAGLILLGLLIWLVNTIYTPVKTEEIKASQPVAVKTTPVDTGQAFFPTYRLQRERIRGQQLELLREIINNSNTDEKSRQSALERLLGLTSRMELELKAEGVLKADGCKEAVVIMQNNDATVVISGKQNVEEVDIQEEIADFLNLESNQVNVIIR
ncbi:MAG: SpoIIIAH-like family protein [Ignavibacteriales bacterium]